MVPLIRHLDESLTGRIRTRAGWFGRQILQVEVTERVLIHRDPKPARGRTYWRDATSMDAHALAAKGFAGLAPGYDKAGCPLNEPKRLLWESA